MKTQPGQRTIRLTLGDFREPVAVEAMLDRAAEAIRKCAGRTSIIRHRLASDHAAIRRPAGLTGLQRSLAVTLPDDPELAMLAAMLKTDQTSFQVDEKRLPTSVTFHRASRPGGSTDDLGDMADQIDGAARQGRRSAAQGQDAAGQLARLQRILWSGDSAAWQRAGRCQPGRIRVEMPRGRPQSAVGGAGRWGPHDGRRQRCPTLRSHPGHWRCWGAGTGGDRFRRLAFGLRQLESIGPRRNDPNKATDASTSRRSTICDGLWT